MSEQNIREDAAGAVPIGDVPPEPGKDAALELALAALPRNDTGNADRFVRRRGHDFLWIKDAGWYGWDGKRWDSPLNTGELAAQLAAQEVAASIRFEADALDIETDAMERERKAAMRDGREVEGQDAFDERMAKHAETAQKHRGFGIGSGNAGKLAAMLELAAPKLARDQDELDADPFLVNVQNFTLELGPPGGDEAPTAIKPRPFDRRDLMTRICEVAYDAALEPKDRPHWEAALARFLPKQQIGVADFMQRLFGYALTGSTEEQAIAIFLGEGNNGKSTFIDLVAWLMGDYAMSLPVESLMGGNRKSGGEATPDLARLPGARLVRSPEPPQGAVFDDGVIKRLTSNAAIPVRHLNHGFFDLTPSFKVMVECNRRPQVRTEDQGLWRRIHVIPFGVEIETDAIDKSYVKRLLRPEGSAILNWLLEGYRAWREQGLAAPPEIVAATSDYRAESDWLGNFLHACCEITGKGGDELSGAGLWWVYEKWCEREAQEPRTRKAFGAKMAQRRGIRKKRSGTVSYVGLRYNQTGSDLSGGRPA